eukprot:Plantae.Rhodophyta-Purpureofilum_apyrenoidigerum.ctg21584.p1 GENE.Plantae.Rhodophyta-Purpureofilum_apyrenoidigerum.ctg21584~~Plantae.Rhodophyta-Purpureofilum_apyrenoidigerum.ctg21584.p1  ORF type:complete len:348 (+),score=79.34 Plantae.Rhodophyta-Purpureofilum_apyrenoidigerum.ctg21584:103-1146(+)
MVMRGLLRGRDDGSEVSKDTCSTFIPEWEDDEEQNVRFGKSGSIGKRVRERKWPLKEPVLTYGDVESDALVGFVTLPHNGLRREIHDLFRMQWALCFKAPRWRELDAFSAWWNIFYGVVTDFLKVEEMLIFAYANFISYKPLQLKNRTLMKRELKEVGQNVSCRLSFMSPSTFEKDFPAVMKQIDRYVAILLDYFHDKEKELPSYLRRKVEDDMVWDINQRMVSELIDSDYGHYAMPVLTKDLKASHLKFFWRETLSHTYSDKQLQSWWRSVEESQGRNLEIVLEGLDKDSLLLRDDSYLMDSARSTNPCKEDRKSPLPRKLSASSLMSPAADRSSSFLSRILGHSS